MHICKNRKAVDIGSVLAIVLVIGVILFVASIFYYAITGNSVTDLFSGIGGGGGSAPSGGGGGGGGGSFDGAIIGLVLMILAVPVLLLFNRWRNKKNAAIEKSTDELGAIGKPKQGKIHSVCEKCEAPVGESDLVCKKCGAKRTSKKMKIRTGTGLICPICRASVGEKDKTCPSCGTKLEGVTEEKKEKTKKCPKCGHENFEFADNCCNCKTPLKVVIKKVICPRCKKENDAGMLNCAYCKIRLDRPYDPSMEEDYAGARRKAGGKEARRMKQQHEQEEAEREQRRKQAEADFKRSISGPRKGLGGFMPSVGGKKKPAKEDVYAPVAKWDQSKPGALAGEVKDIFTDGKEKPTEEQKKEFEKLKTEFNEKKGKVEKLAKKSRDPYNLESLKSLIKSVREEYDKCSTIAEKIVNMKWGAYELSLMLDRIEKENRLEEEQDKMRKRGKCAEIVIDSSSGKRSICGKAVEPGTEFCEEHGNIVQMKKGEKWLPLPKCTYLDGRGPCPENAVKGGIWCKKHSEEMRKFNEETEKMLGEQDKMRKIGRCTLQISTGNKRRICGEKAKKGSEYCEEHDEQIRKGRGHPLPPPRPMPPTMRGFPPPAPPRKSKPLPPGTFPYDCRYCYSKYGTLRGTTIVCAKCGKDINGNLDSKNIPIKIKCPKCSNIVPVLSAERPYEFDCPNCSMKLILKK